MDWLLAVLLVGVSLQFSVFATTLYLHRCLAHRALELHPWVAVPLRLQLWLTTGLVPKEWVAVHRKHHRFADQEGDPHSPLLRGLGRILLGNVYYYAREACNPETLETFAPDVGRDWLDRNLFRHGLLGLPVGLLLFMAVLGPLRGGLAFAAQATLYVVLSAVINGAGHALGYQNYPNTARNLRSVAWVTAGEGLHNNHHQYPTSARFGVHPGEFDPAWPIIRLLTYLRLARPLHLVPHP